MTFSSLLIDVSIHKQFLQARSAPTSAQGVLFRKDFQSTKVMVGVGYTMETEYTRKQQGVGQWKVQCL